MVTAPGSDTARTGWSGVWLTPMAAASNTADAMADAMKPIRSKYLMIPTKTLRVHSHIPFPALAFPEPANPKGNALGLFQAPGNIHRPQLSVKD